MDRGGWATTQMDWRSPGDALGGGIAGKGHGGGIGGGNNDTLAKPLRI